MCGNHSTHAGIPRPSIRPRIDIARRAEMERIFPTGHNFRTRTNRSLQGKFQLKYANKNELVLEWRKRMARTFVGTYWQDEFLQWDPDTYDGATEIFLASTDIWIPEFSLYYSVNFNDAVKLQSNNDVRVNYTGHVRYWIPFSTESLCSSVDVKFFPFDIQRCTLLLGSWAHSNDSIKYSLYSKNLSLIDFYDNQEWQLDLAQSHITSDGFLYDYLDPPLFWEMIVIDLVVARQSFYYVFNLVIPSAIITLVAVIGFHTPSTSGKMRDAKFQLGIMTLMSMSMILLAIVEDMPKFSISSSRKGRGSFSGIPLIGLYYFMLLAIVGMSTVTTSVRWGFALLGTFPRKRRIGFRYSFRFSKTKRARAAPQQQQHNASGDGAGEMDTLLSSPPAPGGRNGNRMGMCGHLNGFAGIGGSDSNLFGSSSPTLSEQQQKGGAQRAARSLLRLIAHNGRGRSSGSDSRSLIRGKAPREQKESSADRPFPLPSPLLRKRHSLLYQENLLFYQCFQQLIEEITFGLGRMERTVQSIRQDMASMVPQNDMESDWQKAIRRLELLSLVFYVSLLSTTMWLFFYHDWYCSIGHNPCGQQNLKCPWLASDPTSPSCPS
uniref:Neurotransmitter-gated ion-channel ligand-binding domain-containing protein n=1 Tax=Globodera rostochiensis TaxID=31243 RepID=A0A914HCW4_GLORO